MPLYEYECPEHGRFELMKPIKFRNKSFCPVCAKTCKKLISLPFIAVSSCTEGVNASQAHENDIRGRYVRPDGDVGREGDRFHQATLNDASGDKTHKTSLVKP